MILALLMSLVVLISPKLGQSPKRRGTNWPSFAITFVRVILQVDL